MSVIRLLIVPLLLVGIIGIWIVGSRHNAVDRDNDGITVAIDCDDNDPAVHPYVVENCYDKIDNNCNGKRDLADPACVLQRYRAHLYGFPNGYP